MNGQEVRLWKETVLFELNSNGFGHKAIDHEVVSFEKKNLLRILKYLTGCHIDKRVKPRIFQWECPVTWSRFERSGLPLQCRSGT
jgi:hypothetical protein